MRRRRDWRAGWLGRLLRIHSKHILGTCWCQPGIVKRFIDGR